MSDRERPSDLRLKMFWDATLGKGQVYLTSVFENAFAKILPFNVRCMDGKKSRQKEQEGRDKSVTDDGKRGQQDS